MQFGLDSIDAAYRLDDVFGAGVEFAALGVMIDAMVALDGGEQSHDLFLADLHAPPHAGAWADGLERGDDEVGITEHKAAGLWSEQSLTAGEDGEIETFVDVLAQPADGGNIGSTVVHGWDAVFLADLDPLRSRDPALGFGDVQEEHHGRALVDSLLKLFPRFDLDGFGASHPNLRIEAQSDGFSG